MRALNQCAHGVSESVVPMAVVAGDVAVFGRVERRGEGVSQGRAEAGGDRRKCWRVARSGITQ